MNRRESLIAGALGAATGVVWAGGLGLLLNRHEPTLEVIGQGDALLALLDTGTFRALVVVGDDLSDRMSSLLGVFRRRIDLLAGSQQGVATIRAKRSTGVRIGRTLVLDVPTGITGPMSETSPTGPAALRATLPDGMTLEFRTHVRGAWQKDATVSQSWTITISRNGHRCVLAPTLEVILDHAAPSPSVAVAPGEDYEVQRDMLRRSIVAVNETQLTASPASGDEVTALRIFPRDPLTFTFQDNGITVHE